MITAIKRTDSLKYEYLYTRARLSLTNLLLDKGFTHAEIARISNKVWVKNTHAIVGDMNFDTIELEIETLKGLTYGQIVELY